MLDTHAMSGPKICVYCGSGPGRLPAFALAARIVGGEFGRRGWGLF